MGICVAIKEGKLDGPDAPVHWARVFIEQGGGSLLHFKPRPDGWAGLGEVGADVDDGDLDEDGVRRARGGAPGDGWGGGP